MSVIVGKPGRILAPPRPLSRPARPLSLYLDTVVDGGPDLLGGPQIPRRGRQLRMAEQELDVF